MLASVLFYNPAFRIRLVKGSSMNLVLFLMAFCAGAAISVQAAVNAQLAASLGANSVAAALVSFACGTLALALAALARGGLPEAIAALPSQPLWKFGGGLLGAAFIFCTVFVAPRIGLVNMLVLIIAGQLLTSMAVDHFGLLNMALRKVSAIRLGGAVIMLAGVGLTLFGDRIVAAMSR
jgi:transporter family-2 protein